jgi:hypothetical protein
MIFQRCLFRCSPRSSGINVSEDNLYDFISEGTEANPELFGRLEFVRCKYCPIAMMHNFRGGYINFLKESRPVKCFYKNLGTVDFVSVNPKDAIIIYR